MKTKKEIVEKMPNGVPRAGHYFMRAILCNDEASTDTELQAHFVSEGVLPMHAALYIKNRTRYLNDFCFDGEETPRWPLKSQEDIDIVMKLEERSF